MERTLADTAAAGIDLATITAELEREGVRSFCDSYDQLPASTTSSSTSLRPDTKVTAEPEWRCSTAPCGAGVIAVVDDARLRKVRSAILEHRAHAVLVVARTSGKALGGVPRRTIGILLCRAMSLQATADTAAAVLDVPAVTGLLIYFGIARVLVL